jgi:hypothetical protein
LSTVGTYLSRIDIYGFLASLLVITADGSLIIVMMRLSRPMKEFIDWPLCDSRLILLAITHGLMANACLGIFLDLESLLLPV